MPPKSKAAKGEWQQCDACRLIVMPKDTEKHEECCAATHATDIKALHFHHDYMADGVLYGSFREILNKPADLTEVSFNIQQNIVFLSPPTMKLLGIGVNDYVVLINHNGSMSLKIVWPSQGINGSSVCLSTYSSKRLIGEKVQVYRYSKNVMNISKLVVSIVSGEYDETFIDAVAKSLKHQYCEKFLHHDEILRCYHMCKQLEFKIISLNSNNTNLANANAQENSISDALNSLSLTSGSSTTNCSTPKSLRSNSKLLFSTPKAFKTDSSTDIINDDFYRVHPGTVVEVQHQLHISATEVPVVFDDLGGLDEKIKELKELVDLPAKFANIFAKFALEPSRSVLLYGPSGCGKSLLARALARYAKAQFITVNGAQVFSSRSKNESDQNLRDVFRNAILGAPSVVFIDDLDVMCPKRDKGLSETESRLISTLVTLIENLPSRTSSKWVLVVGATSQPNGVDESLRRSGRFDKEIEVAMPTPVGRREILGKLLRKVQHSLSEESLLTLSDALHGFSGANIAALCANAALHALSRVSAAGDGDIFVTVDDFKAVMGSVRPTAVREMLMEIPKVKWSDIGGMEDVKKRLTQCIEWPLKYKEAFKRLGIQPPHGLLMYGPPGCSKTMVAKALATESGLNFLAIKGPEVFSKWVGDSEKAVRELFRKARQCAPCVVFFDELDAVATQRGGSKSAGVADRVLAQLLTELDGIENLEDVMFIAATNRPDMIDQALLRPGRLDTVVYVSLPDLKSRRDIIRIQLSKRSVGDEVDPGYLANVTDGFSGAEIVALCQEAALAALEESFDAVAVEKRHFDAALKFVFPRISKDTIAFYEEFNRTFRQQTI